MSTELFFKVLVLLYFKIFLHPAVIEGAILGKDGNYAVLRGTKLKMTCISDEEGESKIEGSAVWTDDEGRELIDARFTKLDNDDLVIVNVHVSDSGTYKCKYRPLSSPDDFSKISKHKLIVYELSGHKFVSSALIDFSQTSEQKATAMLKDLLIISVCGHELCTAGTIKSTNCEASDKKCEFLLSMEALNQVADDRCDEDCARDKMLNALKKAEKILESELLNMSDDPEQRLEIDIKTFNTKHLITCRAGFHLVKAHYKRCFPCMPGYYSESNVVECSMCKLGYYQDSYGKDNCQKCGEGKTTDTMGSKSRDECIAQEKKGILGGIKDGILSIFAGA